MKKSLAKKNINKQKKSKIKELFSRLTVGGASVATVVVVTATSFFVDDFNIETFSDTIYYETYIEPTEITYPENVDPNDPDVEIVIEDVELRLRLSSQFGEVYFPMVLYENKGKITDLNPNTNYELTVQHYNGFQWVALKSQNVRTDIENKASIVNIKESGLLTDDIRSLEVLIYTEFEPEKVRNVRLVVETSETKTYPLIQGENTILLEDINHIEIVKFDIIYDILEDEVWIETFMDRQAYKMQPYFEFNYKATINSLDVQMLTSINSIDEYQYFLYIDRTSTSERIDNIEVFNFINYVDLEKIRIFAKHLEQEEIYQITTIDLTKYRKFPIVFTELDNQYTLTIIDELERIESLYYYDEQGIKTRWVHSDVQDNVYLYELFNKVITTIEITLKNDPNAIYTIEIKGE